MKGTVLLAQMQIEVSTADEGHSVTGTDADRGVNGR